MDQLAESFCPRQTLQVNGVFACDLLTAEYRKHVLEASITHAMLDISGTCDGASKLVMIYL